MSAVFAHRENTALTDIDLSGSVNFRIMIQRGGKIAAAVDRVRLDLPDTEGNDESRESLMVVKTLPLDEQIWKVNVTDGNKPELLLNNKVKGIKDQLERNPLYQALILPTAMKEVLTYYCWNETDGDESVSYTHLTLPTICSV